MTLPAKLSLALPLPVLLTIAFALIGSIYPDTHGANIIRLGAGLIAVLSAVVTGAITTAVVLWHRHAESQRQRDSQLEGVTHAVEDQGIDNLLAAVSEIARTGTGPVHLSAPVGRDGERVRVLYHPSSHPEGAQRRATDEQRAPRAVSQLRQRRS